MISKALAQRFPGEYDFNSFLVGEAEPLAHQLGFSRRSHRQPGGPLVELVDHGFESGDTSA